MEKFLEWFNNRDDVTEFRKSVGGWKSDRSGDQIKKNGEQENYDRSTGFQTNSVKKSRLNFSPMARF